MPSGLVPRYPQGRRIGLTLMGEKWVGTTFLFTSLFYFSLHPYVVLSNASVFDYFFSFIFSLAHH